MSQQDGTPGAGANDPAAASNGPTRPGSRSGQTVTVACALPTGIRLQLHDIKEEPVPILTGGVRMEKIARPVGLAVLVHGWRAPFGQTPVVPVIGRYALTQNVSREFWERWLEQNKTIDVVVNRLLFAYPTYDAAMGAAREHKTNLSGLEPLNMSRIVKNGKKMPADPRLATLAKITTFDQKDEEAA